MEELFSKYGFEFSQITLDKFNHYYEFLVSENEKYNLTSIVEKKDVYVKHFLDSILGEKYFLRNSNVVEIGSGAGFPSVPLMLFREDLTFTLVESNGKKCTFLRQIVDKLDLSSRVKIECLRAEDFAKTNRNMFDCFTARAVAPTTALLEYGLPLIKKGGRLVLYKGESGETEKTDNALNILGGSLIKEDKYELEGMKRTLIIVEKTGETPLKYPRGQGKERSKPL